MPSLQVKDFPEDLYEELKEYAAEEQRSVSQQTIYCLREYLRFRDVFQTIKHAKWALPYVTDLLPESEQLESKRRAERHRLVLERIQERGAIETPEDFPDTVELIREMREERGNQILEAAGLFSDAENKGQQA